MKEEILGAADVRCPMTCRLLSISTNPTVLFPIISICPCHPLPLFRSRSLYLSLYLSFSLYLSLSLSLVLALSVTLSLSLSFSLYLSLSLSLVLALPINLSLSRSLSLFFFFFIPVLVIIPFSLLVILFNITLQAELSLLQSIFFYNCHLLKP